MGGIVPPTPAASAAEPAIDTATEPPRPSRAAANPTLVALPNPVYPPRPDALALCAMIAASPDEVRGFLEARLPARRADPAG